MCKFISKFIFRKSVSALLWLNIEGLKTLFLNIKLFIILKNNIHYIHLGALTLPCSAVPGVDEKYSISVLLVW